MSTYSYNILYVNAADSIKMDDELHVFSQQLYKAGAKQRFLMMKGEHEESYKLSVEQRMGEKESYYIALTSKNKNKYLLVDVKNNNFLFHDKHLEAGIKAMKAGAWKPDIVLCNERATLKIAHMIKEQAKKDSWYKNIYCCLYLNQTLIDKMDKEQQWDDLLAESLDAYDAILLPEKFYFQQLLAKIQDDAIRESLKENENKIYNEIVGKDVHQNSWKLNKIFRDLIEKKKRTYL